MLPSYLILHHTADKSNELQFSKVNISHYNRGFPKSNLGYFVGYHYFIEKTGAFRQSRNDDEVGAHCKAGGMNFKSIGICLAGDFTQEKPTDAQLTALKLLCEEKMAKFNIGKLHVVRHGSIGMTACPGVDLPSLMFNFSSQKSSMLSRLAERLHKMLGTHI